MSNARSPVFSHFGAAINGLTSIRAYNAEEAFKTESLKRIDLYTRPSRVFYNLNRCVDLTLLNVGPLIELAAVDGSESVSMLWEAYSPLVSPRTSFILEALPMPQRLVFSSTWQSALPACFCGGCAL